MQFRSNVLTNGGEIPLHVHSYSHVAMVTQGWFAVKEILPAGAVKEYEMAAKDYRPSPDQSFSPIGYRLVIPAGHQHTFRLLSVGAGEVLCFWPEGV
jgi:hypothetical protein